MSLRQLEIDNKMAEYKAALTKLRLRREPCLKRIDKLKLQGNVTEQKALELVCEIMEGKRYSSENHD